MSKVTRTPSHMSRSNLYWLRRKVMCKNNHLFLVSWTCYRRFIITSLFIALRDADQIELKETP